MSRRTKKFPVGTAEAILSALGAHGFNDFTRRMKIEQIWREAVGETIAGRCHPMGFSRGTLRLSSVSTAWKNQLTFLKQDIVQKLNNKLGEPWITDLRFAPSYVSHDDNREDEVEAPPPWLGLAPRGKDLAHVKETSQNIEDDDLRRQFEKTMEIGMRAERYRSNRRILEKAKQYKSNDS
ncbi:MAG: DUF721 domain-containing protein [Myxococcota bacterium]|nr:DUF721 domain-containing protein [Myxococcota bacterium]